MNNPLKKRERRKTTRMKKTTSRFAAVLFATAMSVNALGQLTLAQGDEASSRLKKERQTLQARAAEAIALNEKAHPRYSSVRISFDAVEGHTYKLAKKNSEGNFVDVPGAGELTAGSFIDENAGAGVSPVYKLIDITDDKETAEFTCEKTGLDALRKTSALAWVDPKDNGAARVFDGTNPVDMSAVLDDVKALTSGTIIVKAKYTGSEKKNGAAILGITRPGQNAFIGCRNVGPATGKNLFGFEFANGLSMYGAGSASAWDFGDGDSHTVTYRAPETPSSSDRIRYFFDGHDALNNLNILDNAKWAGFMSSMNDMTSLSIGGNMTGKSVANPWKGEISHVLVTDEVLSEAECQEISRANLEISANAPEVDPDEINFSAKGEIYHAKLSWNGPVGSIYRDGECIAENATSPFVDDVAKAGSHTYKLVIANGDKTIEAEQTIETGLAQTAILYHDFREDAGENPTVFDGNRLPFDLLEGIDEETLNAVGAMTRGSLVIRFKANTGATPYGLISSHKEGTYAPDWTGGTNKLPAGNMALYASTSKQPRIDLGGGVCASAGTITEGEWHTIVFSNSGLSNGKKLRVVMDGSEVYSFANRTDLDGLFSRFGANPEEILVGGVRKSAGDAKENFGGLFNGEIAYAAVVDEELTDEDALNLTGGKRPALSDMLTGAGDRTWIALGGGLASASMDDIDYHRTYSQIFSEIVRWDYGAATQQTRQRFVLNRSIPGQTIADIDANYDSLVNAYESRAVLLMLDGNEELSDEQIKTSLVSVLEKNMENGRFTVVQIPPVSGDASRDLAAIATAAKAELGFDYTGSVLILDHEKMFKDGNLDASAFDENGTLNAKGHLLIANQMGSNMSLGNSKTVNDSTLGLYSFSKAAKELDASPAVTVSDDSVRASITVDGEFVAELEMDGQKTVRPLVDQAVVFAGLKENTPFTLRIVSTDGEQMLKAKSGTTGKADVTDEADYDELNDMQKKIRELASRDEKTTWLFMGDSITHGILTQGYDSTMQVFEHYIHEDLDRPQDMIINTGVSNGDFENYTANEADRYDRYKNETDVVILMLGTNDSAYTGNDWRYTNYKQNLTNLVKKVKANGQEMVLRVPPKISSDGNRTWHGPQLEEFRGYIYEIAEEYNCIVADHWSLFDEKMKSDETCTTARGTWYIQDTIHPDGRGQLAMAKQVIQEMGLWDKSSTVAQKDYLSERTTTESIKDVEIVYDETAGTLSYDIAALEEAIGRTAGEVVLEVTKEDETISKELIRKEDKSLGSISIDLQDLSGDVEAAVKVVTTDAPKSELVVAKKTVTIKEASAELDYTALNKVIDDMKALKGDADNALPGAWNDHLASLIQAGEFALMGGMFESQEQLDQSTAAYEAVFATAAKASEGYKAIAADKDLDLTGYTDASVSAYNAAKAALQAELDKMASLDVSEADRLIKAYADAKAGLEEKAPELDMTALNTALNGMKTLKGDANNCLPQDWIDFLDQMIYMTDDAIANDAFKTQDDIDRWTASLDSLLTTASAASEGYKALDANKDLDLTGYTIESVAAYNAAKNALETELAKMAGQDAAETRRLTKAYTDARAALEEKAPEFNLDGLKAVIASTKDLAGDEASCLPTDWVEYLNMLVMVGEGYIEDGFTSQEEVDEMTGSLNMVLTVAEKASEGYAALDANKDLDLSIYTDESVAAYNEAKAALEAELAKMASLDVDAADTLINAYYDAFEALQEKAPQLNLDELNAAIASAKDLAADETSCLPKQWVDYLDFFVMIGEGSIAEGFASQEDIDTLTASFNVVLTTAEKASEGYMALDANKALDLSQYTDESVAIYNEAKAALEAELAKMADLDVDAADTLINAYLDAVEGLNEKPAPGFDLSELTKAVNDLKMLWNDAGNCLNEDWMQFLEMMVLSGEAAIEENAFESQDAVDQTTLGMNMILDIASTASEGYRALDANKTLDLSIYTDESVAAYNEAKAALEAELAKMASLDVEETDRLIAAYNAAREALEVKGGEVEVDLSMITYLIGVVEDADLSLYKEEGKAELATALADAKAVLDSKDQAQIDKAMNDLLMAWLDMRLIPNEEMLKDFI